jgi:hypothetical protein
MIASIKFYKLAGRYLGGMDAEFERAMSMDFALFE